RSRKTHLSLQWPGFPAHGCGRESGERSNRVKSSKRQMRSSKHQHPSSREKPGTKLQSQHADACVLWKFRFCVSLVFGAWSLGFLLLAGFNTTAADLTPAQTQFFEGKIRPILVKNCYKCHSSQAEKVKGGLLLDSREGVLKGGESGPAIVPGDPEKSRLI